MPLSWMELALNGIATVVLIVNLVVIGIMLIPRRFLQ